MRFRRSSESGAARWLLALALLATGSCRGGDVGSDVGSAAADAVPSSSESVEGPPTIEEQGWKRSSVPPPVPRGMAWVPPGALVAGTAPDSLPRKAHQEMPGEQVVLDGFFIDEYAYPNEQGGIPHTNISQSQARMKCEEKGKRLCSELEWERACKGPENTTYEYGNEYVAKLCGMGAASRPLPSGYRFTCRSAFGVHDMHGGIWEWTDSAWKRGTKGSLAALRGGNGVQGEVMGRCANGLGKAPTSKESSLGFRCCSGARNAAEVVLRVEKGQALRRLSGVDRELGRALERKLPSKIAKSMAKLGTARVIRLWEWQPLGNEDLLVAGVCAGAPPRRECGVLLVRRTLGRLDVLGWGPSGFYVPTIKLKHDARLLWVYGGDKRAHYRRPISFEWGKVSIGKERRNER